MPDHTHLKSQSGGVHLWDRKTGELVGKYMDKMYIDGVAFSGDGKWRVAESGPDDRMIFDMQDGSILHTSEGSTRTDSIKLSSNGEISFLLNGSSESNAPSIS